MYVITTHSHYDFDALSSLLAAKKLYPNATIILPLDAEANAKQFIDEYSQIFHKYIPAKNIPTNISHLIIVDTAEQKRLPSFEMLINNHEIKKIIFDHHLHTHNDIIYNEAYIKKSGSTTSIILEKLFKKDPNINLSYEEVLLFVLGIFEDTGKLCYPTTTALDKKIIKKLFSIQNLNKTDIEKFLKVNLNNHQKMVLKSLNQNTQIYKLGKLKCIFSYAKIDNDVSDLSSIVHFYRDKEHASVLFCFFKRKNKIYIIARSNNKNFSIIKPIEYFSGGGHATAASCNVDDDDLFKIIKKTKTLFFNNVILQKKIKHFSLNKEKDIIIKNNQIFSLDDKKRLNSFNIKTITDESLYYPIQRISSDETIKSIAKNLVDMPYVFVIDDNYLIRREEFLKFLPYEITKKYYTKINVRFNRKTKRIFDKIKESMDKDISAYIVGGPVRDLVMGIPHLDIDIVISRGDAISLAKKVAYSFNCKPIIFKQFKTAKILDKTNNIDIDIVTSRREIYKYSGALPDVFTSNLWDDLQRRDFTINAMAINLLDEKTQTIIDPFGGLKDINNKIVRVLHNLSFIDDPTRMYRAIRFIGRFGFKFDKKTQTLFDLALKNDLHKNISPYRFREEIKALLSETEQIKIISAMQRYGLINHIHENIKINEQFSTNTFDALFMVLLYIHDEKINIWFIFLMAICKDLSFCELETVAKKMLLSKIEKNILMKILDVDSLVKELKNIDKPSEIYKILNKYNELEILIYILASSRNVEIQRKVVCFISKSRKTRLHIDGNILKKMGVKEGKIYNKILTKLHHAKIDGEINTKEEEMTFVLKNIE